MCAFLNTVWEADADHKLFEKCFIGPRGLEGLEHFWQSQAGQPWCRAHPLLQDPAAFKRTIPIFVHGDDAECYNGTSLALVSFSSLTATGSSWDTRFLTCGILTDQLVKDVTLNEVHGFVRWQLEVVKDWVC